MVIDLESIFPLLISPAIFESACDASGADFDISSSIRRTLFEILGVTSAITGSFVLLFPEPEYVTPFLVSSSVVDLKKAITSSFVTLSLPSNAFTMYLLIKGISSSETSIPLSLNAVEILFSSDFWLSSVFPAFKDSVTLSAIEFIRLSYISSLFSGIPSCSPTSAIPVFIILSRTGCILSLPYAASISPLINPS